MLFPTMDHARELFRACVLHTPSLILEESTAFSVFRYALHYQDFVMDFFSGCSPALYPVVSLG
jgi:hypothetical protein